MTAALLGTDWRTMLRSYAMRLGLGRGALVNAGRGALALGGLQKPSGPTLVFHDEFTDIEDTGIFNHAVVPINTNGAEWMLTQNSYTLAPIIKSNTCVGQGFKGNFSFALAYTAAQAFTAEYDLKVVKPTLPWDNWSQNTSFYFYVHYWQNTYGAVYLGYTYSGVSLENSRFVIVLAGVAVLASRNEILDTGTYAMKVVVDNSRIYVYKNGENIFDIAVPATARKSPVFGVYQAAPQTWYIDNLKISLDQANNRTYLRDEFSTAGALSGQTPSPISPGNAWGSLGEFVGGSCSSGKYAMSAGQTEIGNSIVTGKGDSANPAIICGTYYFQNTSSQTCSIVVRASEPPTVTYFEFRVTGNYHYLYQVSDGAHFLRSSVIISGAMTANKPVLYIVSLNGDTLLGWCANSGNSSVSYISSVNNTSTRHGMICRGTGGNLQKIDNFQVGIL